MNTPQPCDTCKNLYYNCMLKNDPLCIAECKLNFEIGNVCCTQYEPYDQSFNLTAKDSDLHHLTDH